MGLFKGRRLRSRETEEETIPLTMYGDLPLKGGSYYTMKILEVIPSPSTDPLVLDTWNIEIFDMIPESLGVYYIYQPPGHKWEGKSLGDEILFLFSIQTVTTGTITYAEEEEEDE